MSEQISVETVINAPAAAGWARQVRSAPGKKFSFRVTASATGASHNRAGIAATLAALKAAAETASAG
ncbi:MAG TPA: hypothetical protein VHW74_03260 [Mycobacteriales bacterium]|jgi:ribonuclease HI|nr:hypothetical protein [Mycobacteriales bacterium]